MTVNVIQYTTKSPESADQNQELVEKVFAQLHAEDPGGIRYATFRLADGTTFVHVVVHETDDNPLEGLSAFGDFTKAFGDRVSGPPSFSADVTLVGAYRFMDEDR